MDIGWLEDFLALADTGNFTRAAALRNVSQAAFSRRIQGLENWLGVSLIDRGTHPAKLTPEGEKFREEAAATLSQLLSARSALMNPDFGSTAHVRLALPHVLSVGRLALWWQNWSADGKLSASVATGNITDIVAGFAAGSVDMLVCHQGDQFPVVLDVSQFERHVIETDRLRPYVARHLLDAGKCIFPGTDENHTPLLMYARGAYFANLVDLIIDHGPQPLVGQRLIETNMADVLSTFVAAGFGIGWLPDCAVDGDDGAIVPVPQEGWSMDLRITAFVRKDGRSPAADALWRRVTGSAA